MQFLRGCIKEDAVICRNKFSGHLPLVIEQRHKNTSVETV
jgi:hypothetical protein